MALSEEEQRMLDEIERNLYRGSTDYVDANQIIPKPSYRAFILAVVGVFVGIAVMLVSLYFNFPYFGVLGFLIMFISVFWLFSPKNRRVPSSAEKNDSKRNKSTFTEQMEQRWQNRNGA